MPGFLGASSSAQSGVARRYTSRPLELLTYSGTFLTASLMATRVRDTSGASSI